MVLYSEVCVCVYYKLYAQDVCGVVFYGMACCICVGGGEETVAYSVCQSNYWRGKQTHTRTPTPTHAYTHTHTHTQEYPATLMMVMLYLIGEQATAFIILVLAVVMGIAIRYGIMCVWCVYGECTGFDVVFYTCI